MQYVYHMKPNDMKGNELIPLNQLKGNYPELYDQYIVKYSNHPKRSKLLTREIELLDCLWNDVVFLMPVHPAKIFKALSDLDIKVKRELEFYEIPVTKLKDNQNAVYYYSKEYEKGPDKELDSRDIDILNVEEFKMLEEVPRDSIEYWERESKTGSPYGMFPYIPHILSKGNLDVSDCRVIKWNKQIN